MVKDNKAITGYPSIDKPWLKYYSEEAINAEVPNMSIYDWIRYCNRDNCKNIAIDYLGYKFTYKRLFEQIDRASLCFKNIGVNKGDIVTIALPNIPENIISIYALNRIGAIANLIDLRCKGNELSKLLNEAESNIAVVSDVFLNNTLEICDRTSLKKIIVASPYAHLIFPLRTYMKRKNAVPKEKIISTWEDFISQNVSDYDGDANNMGKDVACIVHTSGTTGASKGVMLSNNCFNAMAVQCKYDGYLYLNGDVCLNQVPPFLAYNVILSTHLPLCLGMKIVLLPDYRPDKFVKNIMKYKPNHVMAGPADWNNFLGNKKISDLSFLRSLLSGSDSIRTENKRQINEILDSHGANGHVMEGYGMTGVGSAACTNLPQCDLEGSVGIPLPKMTFCIWDNDNNVELKYMSKGEICITGPTLMNGYYKKESETKEALREHSDGMIWMHTGDMGYIDANGCVFLDGRLKRIIIQHNGMKINPYEIEKMLLKDKAVKECCVVGIRDKTHGSGSVPIAYIVLSENNVFRTKEIEKRLRDLCNENLTERYYPKKYYFMEKIATHPEWKSRLPSFREHE